MLNRWALGDQIAFTPSRNEIRTLFPDEFTYSDEAGLDSQGVGGFKNGQ